MSEWLTQSEAAQVARCSEVKLARERRAGKLAYVPGRPVLIRVGDLVAWMDARVVRRPSASEAKRAAEAARVKQAAQSAALRRHLRRPA
jgi:hypothetical protein